MQKRGLKKICILLFLLVLFGGFVVSQEEGELPEGHKELFRVDFKGGQLKLSGDSDLYKSEVSSAVSENPPIEIKNKKDNGVIKIDNKFKDTDLIKTILFIGYEGEDYLKIMFDKSVNGKKELLLPASGDIVITSIGGGVLIKSKALVSELKSLTEAKESQSVLAGLPKDEKAGIQDKVKEAKNLFYFLNDKSNVLLIDNADLNKAGISNSLDRVLTPIESSSLVVVEARADERKKVILKLKAEGEEMLNLGKIAILVDHVPFQQLTLKTSLDVSEYSPEYLEALFEDIKKNEETLKEVMEALDKFNKGAKKLRKLPELNLELLKPKKEDKPASDKDEKK